MIKMRAIPNQKLSNEVKGSGQRNEQRQEVGTDLHFGIDEQILRNERLLAIYDCIESLQKTFNK